MYTPINHELKNGAIRHVDAKLTKKRAYLNLSGYVCVLVQIYNGDLSKIKINPAKTVAYLQT